jgi:hypothetical protein
LRSRSAVARPSAAAAFTSTTAAGREAKIELAGRVDVAVVATALMTLGSQLPVEYSLSGSLKLKNGTALSFSRKGEIPVAHSDRALGSRP